MNEDVSHKIYQQGYNLESPLASCLLLTSVIGFWVESIGLIEIAVHNHLISNITWWTMKKHWKSHLTKNWLNEWAINGNFHFLSHRCKLIKIVKTNFVKGLKTCSKKSWSFGQPFIQPSGYVTFHIDTNELQTIGSDIDETSSAQQFCSNSTFHLGHTTVYIFVGLMRRTAAVGTFQVTLPVYLINKNSRFSHGFF